MDLCCKVRTHIIVIRSRMSVTTLANAGGVRKTDFLFDGVVTLVRSSAWISRTVAFVTLIHAVARLFAEKSIDFDDDIRPVTPSRRNQYPWPRTRGYQTCLDGPETVAQVADSPTRVLVETGQLYYMDRFSRTPWPHLWCRAQSAQVVNDLFSCVCGQCTSE